MTTELTESIKTNDMKQTMLNNIVLFLIICKNSRKILLTTDCNS